MTGAGTPTASARSGLSATGPRRRDLVGAALAWAFVVLLLASEAALTLPDAGDADTVVASFYARHRVTIIVLQLVGLVAAGLLAAYAARLRRLDPAVGAAGLVTAALACVPGVVTIVLSLGADPAHPAAVHAWNALGPRADDLLFLGITLFGATIAVRPRFPVVARVLGAIVGVLCGARLVLEATGHARGTVESLGPIAFVVLVGFLGILSAVGRLAPGRSDQVAPGW